LRFSISFPLCCRSSRAQLALQFDQIIQSHCRSLGNVVSAASFTLAA
jgi:hypothetical protein